ncbi:MAG TPA: radical SAM protein, partial [Pseudomonadales bacterium]|nr:radical SAM protein [Pseudomonadales bacterium]
MKIKRLALDVELTNRCNALCNFCPRDKTPEQGFMSEAVFQKAVQRAAEEGLSVMLTGQGESLIHPRFDQCVSYLAQKHIAFALTTNAALLTPERSAFVLDSGSSRITFSISDLEEDYEEVYNLDFDTMRRHVDHFMSLNAGRSEDKRSEVWISIVEHDINREKIPAMRAYWESVGVTGVYVFRQITRGGACETGHYFLRSEAYRIEAEALMAQKGISTLCNLAFIAPFVGWNGQYYVCCSDYEKVEPLGSVFDYSLSDMDTIKKSSIAGGNSACLKCNYDPVNVVREAMFEVENGEAARSRISNRLAVLKEQQVNSPELYTVIDWRTEHAENMLHNTGLIAVQK